MAKMPVHDRIARGLPVTSEQAKEYQASKAAAERSDIVGKIAHKMHQRQAWDDLLAGVSHDAELFTKANTRVTRQIKELKLILESAEAKEKERVWLKNKAMGELDEDKLVSGLAGESLVYKRRGEPDKMFGLFQKKPKRMLFLLDTSASMARANDERLAHLVDAVVMLIESLGPFQHKFSVSMVCHSGSGPSIPLIPFGQWPSSESDKKAICSRVTGLARGAVTGDSTMEAARQGIEAVYADGRENADDYFCILISDCNLGRYNINPHDLGNILTGNAAVNAHCIFIAEPQAAEWLKGQLPLGHSHTCMKPADLPKTIADILSSALDK